MYSALTNESGWQNAADPIWPDAAFGVTFAAALGTIYSTHLQGLPWRLLWGKSAR